MSTNCCISEKVQIIYIKVSVKLTLCILYDVYGNLYSVLINKKTGGGFIVSKWGHNYTFSLRDKQSSFHPLDTASSRGLPPRDKRETALRTGWVGG